MWLFGSKLKLAKTIRLEFLECNEFASNSDIELVSREWEILLNRKLEYYLTRYYSRRVLYQNRNFCSVVGRQLSVRQNNFWVDYRISVLLLRKLRSFYRYILCLDELERLNLDCLKVIEKYNALALKPPLKDGVRYYVKNYMGLTDCLVASYGKSLVEENFCYHKLIGINVAKKYKQDVVFLETQIKINKRICFDVSRWFNELK